MDFLTRSHFGVPFCQLAFLPKVRSKCWNETAVCLVLYLSATRGG